MREHGENAVIEAATRAGALLDKGDMEGRTSGRPPSMNEADITAARAMLRVNGISMGEVAARLKVSPSTLYRHLPGGRGAVG